MRLRNYSWLVVMLTYCCYAKSSALPPEVVKQVKATLLPLFGFKDRPPKVEGKVLVPLPMIKMYQNQIDLELETGSLPLPGKFTQSANTVRTFTHQSNAIDKRFPNHRKFRFLFNVTSIPDTEVLKAAELRITKELSNVSREHSDRQYSHRILVEEIVKPGIKGVDGPVTRLLDSKAIKSSFNGIINLDVSEAVKRWLANPRDNRGLLVRVKCDSPEDKSVRLRQNDDETEDIWEVKQPLLITYTDDGKNKPVTGQDMVKSRSKRAVRRHRKGERDPCRRRQMYVNFRDVGWSDWIVAPLGYDAFYCDGECEYPMAEHMNTTNHAIVQSLMNSVRPSEVPKPCCVPTHLSSMSMLYVDSQNKVILKNYKEMVVNGCGCR